MRDLGKNSPCLSKVSQFRKEKCFQKDYILGNDNFFSSNIIDTTTTFSKGVPKEDTLSIVGMKFLDV